VDVQAGLSAVVQGVPVRRHDWHLLCDRAENSAGPR
jgi:hypothetical protein